MGSDKYTPQVMRRARELLDRGYRISRIAARLGLGEDALRCRLDARYRDLRNERKRLARGYGVRDDDTKATSQGAAMQMASLLPDNRTRQARWMGDPPPGRSALDRRTSGEQAAIVRKSVDLLAAQKSHVFIGDHLNSGEAI